MKSILRMTEVLFLLLLAGNLSCTNSNTVYICDSPNAKRYHFKPDCRGLNNCTYRVVKSSLGNAKKQGKTQCGWEKR